MSLLWGATDIHRLAYDIMMVAYDVMAPFNAINRSVLQKGPQIVGFFVIGECHSRAQIFCKCQMYRRVCDINVHQHTTDI